MKKNKDPATILAIAILLLSLPIAALFVKQLNHELKIFYKADESSDKLPGEIRVDSETGVNYFVIEDNVYHSAISPRYNADGTLYVSPVSKNKVLYLIPPDYEKEE